ncbi:gephyrin-like molybdotransferase Glp [Pseudoxanthomonas dokdonensis]|uniref:Molybdopterin molybdenumtransferase n=1 Tax=Pseudoxanthomonas dokdonensis TaxID=344882 RepID=A0A0R0CYJ1_9GAMM|nr:gephyrin-like molybdotransferase Glp [Pseudoxanthomonas dokdonensis]KRG71214.1 molybdopterin biosynthesis protein [Pseudoxanthomonas dokdonensis]
MTGFPSRIAFAEALEMVRKVGAAHATGAEQVPTRRADGRVLAQDVTAPVALPGFDNSRMDGFALRHADLAGSGTTRLRIVADQFAGHARTQELANGECVRITTGAPLPPGADTVVIKEDVSVDGDLLSVSQLPAHGADIRRAGEDVALGAQVLQAGMTMTPARIGLVASLGLAGLSVARRPTVAVFTTGDELVEPGMPLQPGQIYNGNRDMLMALLRQQGLEPTAWPSLPDDPQRIQSMLLDAASAFDLVITSGGVSAGEKDHLPALLSEHGRIHFWKVLMKPGMPVLLGQLQQALVLALPGNPVSSLATFVSLGIPLLDTMQRRQDPAAPLHAALACEWNKQHPRHEFLRGRLQSDGDARLWVQPNPADASHQLRGAADSDVLLVLPEGPRQYQRGDVVQVIRY